MFVGLVLPVILAGLMGPFIIRVMDFIARGVGGGTPGFSEFWGENALLGMIFLLQIIFAGFLLVKLYRNLDRRAFALDRMET